MVGDRVTMGEGKGKVRSGNRRRRGASGRSTNESGSRWSWCEGRVTRRALADAAGLGSRTAGPCSRCWSRPGC